jgi:single-stranded-DNA-specific exonuclease
VSVDFEWQIPEPTSALAAAALARAHGLSHPLVAQVLRRRGLIDDELVRYLRPDLALLHPPAELRNMEAAVRVVDEALRSGRRICVYGDYDVDGTTSAALVVSYLRSRGADVDAFIPLRSEGYGLSAENIRRIAAERKPELLITVDCGTSSRAEVDLARRLGMEVIVTDHHKPTPGKESQGIVINPHVGGDSYPNKGLAGVGVAYKLVSALHGSQPTANLDLVALGTVADVMPLTGENRVIVRQGLHRLGHTHRPGLAALVANSCKSARIQAEPCTHGAPYCVLCGRGNECRHRAPMCLPVRAETIAFQIGPRINARGRMGREQALIVELLTTTDAGRATEIVEMLEQTNAERKEITRRQEEEALDMVDPSLPVIVLRKPDLDKGIAGLVAGRLVEHFARTAIVVGADGSGSARSVEDVDLLTVLQTKFGAFVQAAGHAQAMGISNLLDADGLSRALAAHPWPESLGRRRLEIDAVCRAGDIEMALVEGLAHLEPTGMGNRPALFALSGKVVARSFMRDGLDVRLTVADPAGNGPLRKALWFRNGANAPEVGALVDIAGHLSVNRHPADGSLSVELRVNALRPSEEPLAPTLTEAAIAA